MSRTMAPGGQLQPVLMRHPPSYLSKLGGGGGGGVKPGVGGGSCRGSGGGLPGVGGGGLGLGLGSPSWWNQSWFYNPF